MRILKCDELAADKVSALIYAPPGFGKTTLLGMLPGQTLIVDVDQGSSVLAGSANIDVVRLDATLADLPEVVSWLEKECKYDNLALDSISELERAMLTAYGREGKNDGAPELQHYLRVGFKLTDYVRRLRAVKANVVFTAWQELAEVVSASGERYTQARPLLGAKTADVVMGLCDVVAQIVISSKDGERYLRLKGCNEAIAKDRLRKRDYCRFEELI